MNRIRTNRVKNALRCMAAACVLAPLANAAPWIVKFGQTEAQYQDYYDNELPANYRPISVSVNGGGANARFTSVFIHDAANNFTARHGLNYLEYNDEVAALAGLGYRVVAVDAYGNYPNEAYAAVWVQDGMALADWGARHRMTSADLQNEDNTFAGNNYRMVWLSGEGSGSDRRFAAVWVRNFEGYTTDVVWDLDGATYQETAESRACSGYRPLVVTVYGAANDPRYGAIFLRTDGPNWKHQPHYVARHGQTGGELQDMIDDFGPTTMQPSCIVESGASGDRKFAHAWFDDRGEPALTKTGMNVIGLEPFDGAMSGFVQTRKVPMASVAVTKDERLVFARGYTFAPAGSPITQPETRFRTASVSKSITAVAIMKLIEDRPDLLTLDTTLGDLNDPFLSQGWTDSRIPDEVTIRFLLQHRGGWDTSDTGLNFDPQFRDVTIADALDKSLPITTEDIITYMKSFSLNFDPGDDYAYSNFGYNILGRVIEAVTGQDYETWVVENVLCPVGAGDMFLGASLWEGRDPTEAVYVRPMNNWCKSVFDDERPMVQNQYGSWNVENFDAHGGWVGSAIELARFVNAFTDKTSSPLLDEANIDFMWTQTAESNNSYGAGWQRSGSTWYHNGSIPGTWAYIIRRTDGVTITVLLNQRSADDNIPLTDDDGQLRTDLQNAANLIGATPSAFWPAHDLFPPGEFCVPPCPADLNGDGTVSGRDLALILGGWGPCGTGAPCVGDLNGDGVIDSRDLAMLLGAWGECD